MRKNKQASKQAIRSACMPTRLTSGLPHQRPVFFLRLSSPRSIWLPSWLLLNNRFPSFNSSLWDELHMCRPDTRGRSSSARSGRATRPDESLLVILPPCELMTLCIIEVVR